MHVFVVIGTNPHQQQNKAPDRHNDSAQVVHITTRNMQQQEGLGQSAEKDQLGCIQPLGENGDNGSRTRPTFALDKWLKEPKKDGPFYLAMSLVVHPREDTAAALEAPMDDASSLGYLDAKADNSVGPNNEDKAPAAPVSASR